MIDSISDSAVGMDSGAYLSPTEIRQIAQALGVRPTKTLGQNFVHDASTVRKIVADAGLTPGARVLEVGPGLGSLTLALLDAGAYVSAIEIDSVLARALPETVRSHQPDAVDRFAVLESDALAVTDPSQLAVPPALKGDSAMNPTHLVANLPYNVAVPVLLNLLEVLPSLESVTVMVQAEVADRLAAGPGTRTYGVPSVKLAWYGRAWRGAKISRNVFWPVPNVDSALVHVDMQQRLHNDCCVVTKTAGGEDVCSRAASGRGVSVEREQVFAVIDAAFSQRRKTLRSALAQWAGSPSQAEALLRAAGVDPQLRGEKLELPEFIAIARAAQTA